MAVVSMKQLLESGVHFGHATRRWNPKMASYIFTSRNGIHIIDLKKTADKIEEAYKALFDIVQNGGQVIFVGTKKQAQEAVAEEAVRTGQYFVNQRWLGGTLTNFKTIRLRIKRLQELEKMEETGIFEKLPKKEVALLIKERGKLERNLGGIKEMKKLPEAMFIVDPRKELNAIREAKKLGIKVFGIVDTNCDPDEVDYVIPANDDAIRAVKLITWVMGNAIIEGHGGVVDKYDESDEANQNDNRANRKPYEPRKDFPKKEYKEQPRTTTAKPAYTRDTASDKKEQYTRPTTPRVTPVKEVVSEVKKEQPTKIEPKQEVPKVKVVVSSETVTKQQEKPVAKAVVPQKETAKVEKAPVKKVVPVKEETPKETVVKKTQVLNKDALELFTVAELKAKAKSMGLSGYSALKKAELIDFISEKAK